MEEWPSRKNEPKDFPAVGPAPPPGSPRPWSPPSPGPPASPTVRILQMDPRPAKNGGILKAFCDVEIDGIVIRSLRIICQPGGFPQLLMPQISVKPAGRPVFFRTVITLPKPWKDALDFAVLCAWKESMAAGQKEKDGGRLDQTLS
jgi:hypothetical protein